MTNPLAEMYAQIEASFFNQRKVEEAKMGISSDAELLEPCLAISPPKADGTGEEVCYLPSHHKGAHTWQKLR